MKYAIDLPLDSSILLHIHHVASDGFYRYLNIDGTLKGTTTPRKRVSASKGDEGILHIQSTRTDIWFRVTFSTAFFVFGLSSELYARNWNENNQDTSQIIEN